MQPSTPTTMTTTTYVPTVCRCCVAGCGIVAQIAGGELVSVRGDVDHPLSRGYICTKGSALPWTQSRPERLDYPTIDGVRVGWDEFLDDLSSRLAAVVSESGGNAVGWYEG